MFPPKRRSFFRKNIFASRKIGKIPAKKLEYNLLESPVIDKYFLKPFQIRIIRG
jgi:hypothetical protein